MESITPTQRALLKDVVYFFHVQSDYPHIEYDLPWGDFRLAYWRCLGTDRSAELAADEAMLVERGCLLIIYAASMAQAANVTEVFSPDAIEECRRVIADLHYDDDVCERLRDATEKVMTIASQPNHMRPYGEIHRLSSETAWASKDIVQQYFDRVSKRITLFRTRNSGG